MSQAPTILHGHESHAGTPRARPVFGILTAATAAAVIASLLMAAVLNRTPAVADLQPAAIEPAAPVAAAAPPSTSVPDASTVFTGKETPDEEPAPTF